MRVALAGVNPVGKVTSIIAGMAAGTDSIDDLAVRHAGRMDRLLGGVYAPATLIHFLREFAHCHNLPLASVMRGFLANSVEYSNLLPGREARLFVFIDSLLRPGYGHAKQAASFGYSEIAKKQAWRKGLSPLVTTISTEPGAPVVAGEWLPAGKASPGTGAAKMVAICRLA